MLLWLSRLLIGGLTLLYPLAVYWALTRGGVSMAVLALVPIAVIHLVRAAQGNAVSWVWFALCLMLGAWTWLAQSSLGVKAYPVLVSGGLLLVFVWTLVYPPTAIERLAKLREPALPPSGVRYTRHVTWVWVGFFAINGSIAAATLWAEDYVWALYNGLISYLLMGALFLGEFLFRQRYRRRQND
ncbi:hypothetical protein [Marinobacter changyiensis]|uniref:COG4648 family protein n=1 Tax=Marinobacter changyiensis TaxID=2604091 RepID=UPI0012651260|nr:hypothetical protein [Marinobacter changyiensis]